MYPGGVRAHTYLTLTICLSLRTCLTLSLPPFMTHNNTMEASSSVSSVAGDPSCLPHSVFPRPSLPYHPTIFSRTPLSLPVCPSPQLPCSASSSIDLIPLALSFTSSVLSFPPLTVYPLIYLSLHNLPLAVILFLISFLTASILSPIP